MGAHQKGSPGTAAGLGNQWGGRRGIPWQAWLHLSSTPGLWGKERVSRKQDVQVLQVASRGARRTQQRSREANSSLPPSNFQPGPPLAEPWGNGLLIQPRNTKSQSHSHPRERTKEGISAGRGLPVCRVRLELSRTILLGGCLRLDGCAPSRMQSPRGQSWCSRSPAWHTAIWRMMT